MGSFIFSPEVPKQNALREAITNAYRKDEDAVLNNLLKEVDLPETMLRKIAETAERLVIAVRQQRVGKGGIDAFLAEYDLSSEEGIALMCLAEAALRVPDTENVDRLIHDKITSADWESHRGKNDSYFVNAASWALMLTGKILKPEQNNEGYFSSALKRLGEPVIRKAVHQAMKILGQQFVMGRTIQEALQRSRKEEKRGYRFSFDMLGEAARTAEDAQRYFTAYQDAITAIAKAEQGKDLIESAGISIKISALHPRYELAQHVRCLPVLIERLTTLTLQAKAANINLTIDAEEADRLDISLDIIEAVVSNKEVQGWNGFGVAVQAYQKRAFYVIDWLANLARKNRCTLLVRLVKGAYWDYEIKDSQIKGLSSYPVFTRKVNTDVSYLACAKKLLEYGKLFYPQFATHNAYTIACVLGMAGERRDFEFQCLKGMGRALYDEIVPRDKMNIPCRVYAPVGQHEDLLPYLVRRLLENGANTSFVNRIVDEKMPIKELIAHPPHVVQKLVMKSHPKIPLPENLYAPGRKNSHGMDLSNYHSLDELALHMEGALANFWHAASTASSQVKLPRERDGREVQDPSDHHRIVGTVVAASEEDLEIALKIATKAAANWDQVSVEQRADYLEKIADLIEANYPELIALVVREAGKTIPDALGEVREAADFCRYYAMIARQTLVPTILPGPTGETNQLHMHGRGVFLCVSPWNFPLAIFTGQVVAALVAGNCVIAKPAEQTSLTGAKAVELMHQAGIPVEVVQLLPGKGSVIGASAVADERINGVMFTGSTETARGINQTLAERKGPIVPFIAETGGQNVLIADSTALPEQLVVDVMTSAFNSAGQRCSALRVLFIQNDVADKFIHMLQGAMSELKIGDPSWLSTDIGPVIDKKSKEKLEAHARRMSLEGKLIYEVTLPKQAQYGSFFAPCAFEIAGIDMLPEEVFGPILHVIRYDRNNLDNVINSINATGYGLTLGIHSRINTTVEYIQSRVHVGNIYVNRNMIGAVVGVQPFGGEGLSGTGPKAGGPHYLTRLCHERTITVNTAAAGGNATLMSLGE